MNSEQLTLTIISPEKLELEPIKFNYEELKSAIVNIATTYKAIEYDENQMKVAKTDRATLRKFRTALEDKRKDIKALCLKPYEDFEQKIKDLVELIDEPIQLIDTQVKEYEQKLIDEKLELARGYFEDKAKELTIEKIVTWEQVYDKRFENLTMTTKKIEEQLDASLEQIKRDWEVINGMDTPFSFEIKKVFIENHDLSLALAKEQDLKRQAEEKAAYEKANAEQKAKDEERRKAEIAEATQTLAGEPKQQPFYEISEEKKPDTQPKTQEQIYQLSFRVRGTREQLVNLSNFLRENQYNYEQIK